MTDQLAPRSITHECTIDAPPDAVWEALTRVDRIPGWLAEPHVGLEVTTDWTVDSPVVMRGSHNGRFVNSGIVHAFEPPRLLRYSQLSSTSRLPDIPDNRTMFEFHLGAVDDGTALTITISGFPTESIFKHQEFYWRGTVGILKRFVEGSGAT